MRPIDLRSDTVTRPTPAMRRAMAEAEVGDDVYGEDPTVNRLEQRAAEIFGKQAALFVPSGTMANTIAVKLHTTHGQEVICDARSHILDYELCMTAWFSGCLVRAIPTLDGILRWPAVEREIRRPSPYWAPTALVALENTHNLAGGVVYPREVFREVCAGAHAAGLRVHLDGARIFNAAAYHGCPVRELAEGADTVAVSLSKGLGAPVGSVLVGAAEDMARARLYRKRLGGGMRQAGILAAAGLIALEEHPARLAADHANARLFAETIAAAPGIHVDPAKVQTNIVLFELTGSGIAAPELAVRLAGRGVLLTAFGPRLLRAVTHYDVTREEAAAAAASVVELCTSAARV